MKTLPVPPLQQTLDAYLAAVAPLVTDDELASARRAVEEFATGDGPACQEALESFATEQDAAGGSWLWEAWLDGYNTTRTPLPLVSNVGFEIALPTDAAGGLDRVAEIIHRMASAYLVNLRGEAAEELSPRGEPLDQSQWDHIEGGIRDPRRGIDVWLPGRRNAAHREVLVLSRGHAATLQVSDAAGQPLSVSAIRRSLDDLAALEPRTRGAAFTAAGYLANDDAADALAELFENPDNIQTYERLRHTLLAVNLVHDPADLVTHLEQTAFAPGQAWPFKPFTLQVGLADDYLGLHLEHSTLDGSTAVAALGLAQAVTPVLGTADDAPAATRELAWTLTDEQRARLDTAMDSYAAEAGRYRTRIEHVTAAPVPPLPFTVSMDAILQEVLLYAQLRAYGRARSTYESVDMREYQGGRTECLRPVTAPALALAQALLDGTATADLLAAQLDAHREQVKRCKRGQAIDRHLFGLRLMAQRHGLYAPIFDDPAYRALTTDFLSTTSLGETSRIVRAAFAPTSAGGIGVYYLWLDGIVDLTITVHEGVTEGVEDFVAGVREGVERLWALLDEVATR